MYFVCSQVTYTNPNSMVASLQAMGVFSFRSILDQRHNKYDIKLSSVVLDTKILNNMVPQIQKGTVCKRTLDQRLYNLLGFEWYPIVLLIGIQFITSHWWGHWPNNMAPRSLFYLTSSKSQIFPIIYGTINSHNQFQAGLRFNCRVGPREQFNEISSFLDAGTVYSNKPERQESLR